MGQSRSSLTHGQADDTRFFAYISATGPVRYGQIPGSLGILDAPDHPMPIGLASGVGWDGDGLAVWRLTIKGVEVPGRWAIIDREFRPVKGTVGEP
jgi:hypothetical protein